MTEREFCYWLQGHLELQGKGDGTMSRRQVDMVRRHLALVFRNVTAKAPKGKVGSLLERMNPQPGGPYMGPFC